MKIVKRLLLSMLCILSLWLGSCSNDDSSSYMVNLENSLGANSPLSQLMLTIAVSDSLNNNLFDCASFVYPISATRYRFDVELVEAIEMSNDEEMVLFIRSLATYDLAELDFPIAITNENEETIFSSNLISLEENIQTELDSCLTIVQENCITANLAHQLNLQDYIEQQELQITTNNNEVQEFTFSVNNDAVLCSLAYQDVDDNPFLITILNASNIKIYEQFVAFSQTEHDEVYIDPLPLLANENYTLRRSKLNYENTSELQGIVLAKQNFETFSFPLQIGAINYKSTAMYGAGETQTNIVIPYITVGLQ